MRRFKIKLFNNEYWPMWVNYFPVFPYIVYLSLRARSAFFFRAINPGMYAAGLVGEDKYDVLRHLPEEMWPRTVYVAQGSTTEVALAAVREKQLKFPLVAKPNVGERGLLVIKINEEEGLRSYLDKCRNHANLLVQEYADLPFEAAVFYYRFPSQEKGDIYSLTLKKFLSVTGDGRSTMLQLIDADDRAFLVRDSLVARYGDALQKVLPQGETQQLEPIGNHVRGTMFIDGNQHIDQALRDTFDKITAMLPGVNCCRYDLRCTNMEDLKAGKNIKILEVNGMGAEPAHIYDPAFTLLGTWKVLLGMWSVFYRIARENHRLGHPYLTFREGRKVLKDYGAYIKALKGL